MRRDFIANAAHELRTPLTNLQGYLEALRDGVIVADQATYESLHEEADRLVRLSRSLDALAEGDAAGPPPELVAIDLAAAVRSAVDLAQPALERAGLRADGRDPDRPAGAGEPGPPRPGAREPALERGPLHAPRRSGHGPGRAAPGRPARLDREHLRADPAGGSRPRLRALLPRREVARPRARWRGHRPRDREAAGTTGTGDDVTDESTSSSTTQRTVAPACRSFSLSVARRERRRGSVKTLPKKPSPFS